MPGLLPPPEKMTAPADTKRARDKAAKEGKPFLVLPNIPQDVAHASDLLTKAQSIVSRELTRLDAKSFDKGLDSREVASVVTLIKAVAEINREERELAKRSGLDGMSDEELRTAAKLAMDKRPPPVATDKELATLEEDNV